MVPQIEYSPTYIPQNCISPPTHFYKLAQMISVEECKSLLLINTCIAIQAKNKRRREQRRQC